jgi:hypothetical protein
MRVLAQAAVLSIFISLAGCAQKRFDAALSDARGYWSGVTSYGQVDSMRILPLVMPFMNEPGICYLAEKLHSKNNGESETATLLLAAINDLLVNAISIESERGKVASLIALVEASQYRSKAMEYSKSGGSVAIRGYLSGALAAAKRGPSRTKDVHVSGEEDWTVARRTYRISNTRIKRDTQGGAVYVVTVDGSGGVMSQLMNVINEEPTDDVIPGRAIAKHALDNGYFTRARKTRVPWAQTQLQDRIVVFTDRNRKVNSRPQVGPDDGWTIRDLEGKGPGGAGEDKVGIHVTRE